MKKESDAKGRWEEGVREKERKAERNEKERVKQEEEKERHFNL